MSNWLTLMDFSGYSMELLVGVNICHKSNYDHVIIDEKSFGIEK